MPPKGKSKALFEKQKFVGKVSANNKVLRDIENRVSSQERTIAEKENTIQELEQKSFEQDTKIYLSSRACEKHLVVEQKKRELSIELLELRKVKRQIKSTSETLSSSAQKRRKINPTSNSTSLRVKTIAEKVTVVVEKHGKHVQIFTVEVRRLSLQL